MVFGIIVFGEKSYAAITLAALVLACVPFFLSFERSKPSAGRVVLLAVMVALSVSGRFVFAPLQFFKPVTAMVILAGMYFGSEFGFLTGALSAVISNFYFGHGPWTPFQMFAWGIIGCISGILSVWLKKNRPLLLLYGGLCGILYSLIMDVWTALWADGKFVLSRFIAAALNAAPITAIYIVSNIIFLAVLAPLFGRKIERLKTKYEI